MRGKRSGIRSSGDRYSFNISHSQQWPVRIPKHDRGSGADHRKTDLTPVELRVTASHRQGSNFIPWTVLVFKPNRPKHSFHRHRDGKDSRPPNFRTLVELYRKRGTRHIRHVGRRSRGSERCGSRNDILTVLVELDLEAVSSPMGGNGPLRGVPGQSTLASRHDRGHPVAGTRSVVDSFRDKGSVDSRLETAFPAFEAERAGHHPGIGTVELRTPLAFALDVHR